MVQAASVLILLVSFFLLGIKLCPIVRIDTPTVLTSSYESRTSETQKLNLQICQPLVLDYDVLRLSVNTTGFYKIVIGGGIMQMYGKVYKKYFHPFRVTENVNIESQSDCGFMFTTIHMHFDAETTYILVMSSVLSSLTGQFNLDVYGLDTVTFNRMGKCLYLLISEKSNEQVFIFLEMVPSTYMSALTKDSSTYSRICRTGSYHYETVEVNVEQNGVYGFRCNSSIILYGYIYENTFDPFHPDGNLLMSSNHTCSIYEFEIVVYLQVNIKYVLVVTTSVPYTQGPFSVLVIGPGNFTLHPISESYISFLFIEFDSYSLVSNHDDCRIGDQCRSYTRAIGLTLDDVFYNKIRASTPWNEQSVFVQITAAITMIMFAAGLINGILSVLTFKNKELRRVGCGMYLLMSSITSLITIALFTAKFWFFVLLEMNIQFNLFAIRAMCMSIEFFLKASLYLDGWLNACIAIERTVAVFKQVNFDKKKSKYAAKWILLCLPFLITSTVMHDPLHRRLFEYQTQTYKIKNTSATVKQTIEYDLRSNRSIQVDQVKNQSTEYDRNKDQFVLDQTQHHQLCVVEYSTSIQTYNIAILFIHLLVPFIANLCSALYIIFGTARQRSNAQRRESFRAHIIAQIREHKQLLISPLVLLMLSLPRLIIALIPGCINPSSNEWFYLFGYFISFIPPMLIFVIFVLPSKLYKKSLKETFQRRRQR